MLGWVSARVFSLVFMVAYGVSVATDHPLFIYYPLVNRWSMSVLTEKSVGPGMMWYGWIAGAAVSAAIVSFLVPQKIGARIPAQLFWVGPPMLFAICWLHERAWFG